MAPGRTSASSSMTRYRRARRTPAVQPVSPLPLPTATCWCPDETWIFDIRDRFEPDLDRHPASLDDADYVAKGATFGPHNLHENRPGSFQSSEIIFETYRRRCPVTTSRTLAPKRSVPGAPARAPCSAAEGSGGRSAPLAC